MLTSEWVQVNGISAARTPPPVADYDKPCARTLQEIVARTIVLQGVVAVAAEVDPAPIIEWFHQQQIWDAVTAEEKAFLGSRSPTENERHRFGWHKEAEWTLLWVIGKVDALGLPTSECDMTRLVDEIIPPLGSQIDEFLSSCQIRPPGVLLAEDDRTYNMWSYAQRARRHGKLPEDLNWGVLFERRYAFEWLDGNEDWDKVTCDA